jgi:membrane-associated PAP2 superfamily phosphatase
MPVPASELPAKGFVPAALPAGAPVAPALPAWREPGFYRLHGQWPLLALAVAFTAWTLLHGDLWLADRLYAWEGHAWLLRRAWVTQNVIHLLGRELSTAAWLAVLAAFAVACMRASWRHLRRPLLYLLVATAVSTLLVAWIKSWSNVDCPWDLARYGGARAYFGLFEPRPAGMGRGVCFPAGHAGGGYTWLALYFFLLAVRPRLRWFGLAVGLSAGLLFGISQQLRGAHFLSHDLAAIAICWGCAVLTQRAFWHGDHGLKSPAVPSAPTPPPAAIP